MVQALRTRFQAAFLSLLFMSGAAALGPVQAQETTAKRCGTNVVLTGPINDAACTDLEALLSTLARKPDKKIWIERQRARENAEHLRVLMISEGYYSATVLPNVSPTISPPSPDQDATPTTFTITPNARFKITGHKINYTGEPAASPPQDFKAMIADGDDLRPASPRGDEILKIQESILGYLRNHGRPQAELLSRKVMANFETATATLVWEIGAGPACTYGPLKVEGLKRLKPSFVTATVDLTEGKACAREVMEAQRVKLAKTGLFVAVDVKPLFSAGEGTARTIQVDLKEAKARTVGAGLSYATNRGVGGKIYWEHRNLLGGAERLRIELDIEEIQQQGTISFTKPWPARGARVFVALGLATEDLDAYDATRYSLKLGANYPLWGPWHLSHTIEYEYADIEEMSVREKGHSLMVPVILSQTTIDNPLDPVDGIILTLTGAPAYSTFGSGTAYVKLDARAAHHLPLGDNGKYTLSTWGHFGSLQGGAADDIPATQLYYGGGAKSVRAIAWERLGTLDPDNIPIGGRSILDGGIELRANVRRTWQIAGFIEGGRVFKSETPDFEEDILWGGGLGLRYKTPIGPLRFDLAIPFNPRESDDDFQIYVGLGQAF